MHSKGHKCIHIRGLPMAAGQGLEFYEFCKVVAIFAK